MLETKKKLGQEIADLMNLQSKQDGVLEGKEVFQWQQPEAKTGFSFQLIHLLITAIVCLFIGGYLGGHSGADHKFDPITNA